MEVGDNKENLTSLNIKWTSDVDSLIWKLEDIRNCQNQQIEKLGKRKIYREKNIFALKICGTPPPF